MKKTLHMSLALTAKVFSRWPFVVRMDSNLWTKQGSHWPPSILVGTVLRRQRPTSQHGQEATGTYVVNFRPLGR
eukprot:2015867-Karenia_brevis.AAC.1